LPSDVKDSHPRVQVAIVAGELEKVAQRCEHTGCRLYSAPSRCSVYHLFML
jgi:hypothetical protein